jgi:hypothetical protein
MHDFPFNILSIIPAEGWAAVYLDREQDDPEAEVPRLIQKPLAAWAHFDVPEQPVIGLVAGTTPDERGRVDLCPAAGLVGYLHHSEGLEALALRLQALRGVRPDRPLAAPGWLEERRAASILPAPGWSAVYLDLDPGTPLPAVPAVRRQPLVCWAHLGGLPPCLEGWVVGANPAFIGPGDLDLRVGYLHKSQPMEVLRHRIEDLWEYHVWLRTPRPA